MIAVPDADLLRRLEEWCASQCNGEWQHTYGISISTPDNPGWSFKVDVLGTDLFDRTFDEVHVEGRGREGLVCRQTRESRFRGSQRAQSALGRNRLVFGMGPRKSVFGYEKVKSWFLKNEKKEQH